MYLKVQQFYDGIATTIWLASDKVFVLNLLGLYIIRSSINNTISVYTFSNDQLNVLFLFYYNPTYTIYNLYDYN